MLKEEARGFVLQSFDTNQRSMATRSKSRFCRRFQTAAQPRHIATLSACLHVNFCEMCSLPRCARTHNRPGSTVIAPVVGPRRFQFRSSSTLPHSWYRNISCLVTITSDVLGGVMVDRGQLCEPLHEPPFRKRCRFMSRFEWY